jgi:hypothetical protein
MTQGTRMEGPRTSILVEEDGVAGCWDEGAEILITSHTLDFIVTSPSYSWDPPTSVGNGLVGWLG